MPIVSGTIGAILNNQAANYATDTNKEMNRENNEFNAAQAEISRGFSATEAQKVRDFEERMANTELQRRYADAEAAGINPVAALLGSGGASTPSVAAAHSSQAQFSSFAGAKAADFSSLSNMSNGLTSLANSAIAVKTLKSLGNASTLADVSKILTSAKTAKAITSLAKILF